MNKFIIILIGLICLMAPIYAWIVNFAGFGSAALAFLKGGAVWVLILIGIGALVAGFSSLKE